LDVGRVLSLVAKSREADLVRTAASYLSLVVGPDFDADCLAAFRSSTSRFARQQISALLVRLTVACVDDVNVIAAKLKQLRSFLLEGREEGLVEFAFYPTLSALVDEGAGDLAAKFITDCGDVDVHDFGGVGSGREFFRSALTRMERDEMLLLFQRLLTRGIPETDAEWRMYSLIFEVWGRERATLLEMFPVKEMVVGKSDEVEKAAEIIFGRAGRVKIDVRGDEEEEDIPAVTFQDDQDDNEEDEDM
jgi:hypothetical protein